MSDIVTENTELKEVLQENPIVEAIPTVESEETAQQINWKKFREARDQERKQREAAEKIARDKSAEAQAMKEAMEAILNRQQPQQQQQYNDPDFESEDVRIQKKVEAAIAEREKRYERDREEREQKEYPQRLRSAYSDFNDVCSADNLDYLDFHYPEIAKAFGQMNEGFDKWTTIYNAVKKLIPNAATQKKDAVKMEKNLNKPQSMSVAGATATGDSAPQLLDDKRKADNWARMQRVRKGV